MTRDRRPEVAPSLIQRVLDDIEAFTPAEGANLVGVDRFELPGEAAYLIAWFATRAEAEKALADRKRRGTDDDLYVYSRQPATRQKGPRRRASKPRKTRGRAKR